jgi:TonB family protein
MSAAAAANAPLYTKDNGARMPGSAVTSLILHCAVLGLWLYTMQNAAKHTNSVITGVDIITVKKAVTNMQKPQTEARKAATTFDFLKMALPTVPHVVKPQMAQIKLPDAHKPLQVQAPKLSDRGRLAEAPKLNMDVDRDHSLDAAKIEARIPTRKLSAMANAPKLEDIGRRRVANLPAALALEERRQEASALQGMDALKNVSERRSAVTQAAAIQDAAPAAGRGSFSNKIASLLPEQTLDQRQAVMPQPVIKGTVEPAVRETRRAQAVQHSEPKKGIEIEGPLADRKVVNYEIPEFPQWAKDQGVLEASVAIRFWVDKAGVVLPNMRVENTSGYGRLDRLAMDSLSKWKFAPLISEEKQWGVITFRFLLE